MTKGLNITNVTPKNEPEDIKGTGVTTANKNTVDLSCEPEINEGKQEIDETPPSKTKTNGQQKQYKQQLITPTKKQPQVPETTNGHSNPAPSHKSASKEKQQRPPCSVGEMDWVEWADFMENQVLRNSSFILTEVNQKANYTLRQPNRRNQVVSCTMVMRQCAILECRIEKMFKFKKLSTERKKKLFETVGGFMQSSQGASGKFLAETLQLINRLNKTLDKIESSDIFVQEREGEHKIKKAKADK